MQPNKFRQFSKDLPKAASSPIWLKSETTGGVFSASWFPDCPGRFLKFWVFACNFGTVYPYYYFGKRNRSGANWIRPGSLGTGGVPWLVSGPRKKLTEQ